MPEDNDGDGYSVNDGDCNGTTYTLTYSYPEPDPFGNMVAETETVEFALSSNTAGAGRYNGIWSANDESFSCEWGCDVSIKRD